MTEQTKDTLQLNGVRPWAVWCITHRLAWVVNAAIIFSLPVFAVYDACTGCLDGVRDWRRELARARAAIKKAEGT